LISGLAKNIDIHAAGVNGYEEARKNGEYYN
jgi:hypothetical protein